MRTDEEILELIEKNNKLLDIVQKKVDEAKIRNLTNIADKKDLFLNEFLPLFVVVNILADRQKTLYWALGRPVEVIMELEELSKITFNLIRKNLEAFSKYL